MGILTAPLLKYNFIDTDSLIEKQMGKPVQSVFKENGEDFFRSKEADVLRGISKNKNALIAVGGGLPCFHANMQWMNEHGLTVYLEASAAFLFHRLLKEKSSRPLISHLSDVELMIYITETLAARRPYYEKAILKVNAETSTVAKLFSALSRKIN